MVLLTRLLGVVLVVVGVGAYVLTGAEHVTALLPAFLGVPILVLGLVAGGESRQRPAIIAATVLAVLGVLGTAMNVAELPDLVAGEDVERPAAVITSAITAVLCLVYAVAGIRWLVASRSRSGQPGGGGSAVD
jgi:uncharacterized membrane protein